MLEGPDNGRTALIRENGWVEGALGAGLSDETVRDAALAALGREASATAVLGAAPAQVSVFFEVFPRPPRLVIFGGVHIAVALVPLARALGYRTIVADGRPAFLTRDRFPDADELIVAWPEQAFEQIRLDASCYVCILSHDPKFDEPALTLALRSAARYIGAIGSARPRRRAASGSRRRASTLRRSPACTGRSGSISAGGNPPRRRWRFWRR